MRVAVLTSSRADYSIYYPLLREMQKDPFFEVSILAFGTHLSKQHGYTLDAIKDDGFHIGHCVETVVEGDTPETLALSMAKTVQGFAPVWAKEKYDLVFCLGDRYEMFAAVSASVPFRLRVAHISGGETTLGAIDNIFRHSLTLMSSYHFVVAGPYKTRVAEIIGSDHGVYNVGALSFDNLKKLSLLPLHDFNARFGIDLSIPTILITFHPETVSYEKNNEYIRELVEAMDALSQNYQLLITMPNADTMGNMIREKLNAFIAGNPKAIGVESLGTVGYLTAMKYCSFMLGNTSSGFVEASYFPKYVINLGERQTGRIMTPNIYNCNVIAEDILECVKRIEQSPALPAVSIYGDGNAAANIVKILKTIG